MFKLDINRAIQNWLNLYRIHREPILKHLDYEYMRAFELNDVDKMKEISLKKLKLRDLTKTDLSNIKHPHELKNHWPSELGELNIKI